MSIPLTRSFFHFPPARHVLNSEECSNALLMIQPSLVAFRLDGTDEAVLLDSASIQPDVVLLMDSFFHIVIYAGDNIAKWRKAGYLLGCSLACLSVCLPYIPH